MTTNIYKAELDLAVAFHKVAVKERDLARAQLHADDHRAWEALGWPEGTYDTTNVQRLCAEVERLRSRVGWLDHLDTPEGRAMHATEAVRVENEQLRADLLDALDLLDNLEIGHQEWLSRWRQLREKHKETP